ncbi:MAG: tRNA (adenosine(37)-N6)-dimethylallyltransferase MiaA [Bacteroidaceae bacterium]|nr:tRNA (adenosine(37)-N6)-dimethylallyltransferase MiaA [Bacteroidaceae bacterium]
MKTLVVITGPTAVGKTELSLHMAKFLLSPVISADSRQMYRQMSIGTAAPTPEELAQAKHLFVHNLDLEDYYSAAMYETDVLKVLSDLFLKQDFALMSGGSMMYVDAVCNGIDDMPTVDDEVRNMMWQRLNDEGPEALLSELRLVDPEYYQIADLKNTKRILHALEVYYMTGKPFSSFRTGVRKQRPFRVVKIGLNREREVLFQRINRRVDQMMEQGLMDEARRLYPYRHLNSLNTVGYKELFNVIDGTWPLPMAIERIKKNTRVYAKKQLTWMKKDPDIHWVSLDGISLEEAVGRIKTIIF